MEPARCLQHTVILSQCGSLGRHESSDRRLYRQKTRSPTSHTGAFTEEPDEEPHVKKYREVRFSGRVSHRSTECSAIMLNGECSSEYRLPEARSRLIRSLLRVQKSHWPRQDISVTARSTIETAIDDFNRSENCTRGQLSRMLPDLSPLRRQRCRRQRRVDEGARGSASVAGDTPVDHVHLDESNPTKIDRMAQQRRSNHRLRALPLDRVPEQNPHSLRARRHDRNLHPKGCSQKAARREAFGISCEIHDH